MGPPIPKEAINNQIIPEGPPRPRASSEEGEPPWSIQALGTTTTHTQATTISPAAIDLPPQPSRLGGQAAAVGAEVGGGEAVVVGSQGRGCLEVAEAPSTLRARAKKEKPFEHPPAAPPPHSSSVSSSSSSSSSSSCFSSSSFSSSSSSSSSYPSLSFPPPPPPPPRLYPLSRRSIRYRRQSQRQAFSAALA